MQPEINILGIDIQTFGLAFAFAFLGCGLIAAKRFKELGKPADWAYEAVFAAFVGGLIGARIDYFIQNYDKVKGDILGNIFSGTGLVFIGGVVGGAIGVAIWGRWRKFFGAQLLDLAAPAIALGYAIGRIGCQLSGDGDYGIPWDGPWAMAYPNGTVPTTVTVHPTPIYETLAIGLLAWWLFRMRNSFKPGLLMAFYLFFAGLERFLVEFIRINDEVLVGLTVPQVEGVVVMVIGAVWLAIVWRNGGWGRDESDATDPRPPRGARAVAAPTPS
ncbi:MAG: prolipoprotein diacylglyceryl transferase [Solirubrobacterales bacterium]|nr:prolipoprotein diacylglyceryl transferase [Solirubrobacterales bacterium]